MSPVFYRYGVPGVIGAAIAFLVRLVFGNLSLAVIGLVVFSVCYATVLALARVFHWQDAPVLYSAISAIGATMAFILTGARP